MGYERRPDSDNEPMEMKGMAEKRAW